MTQKNIVGPVMYEVDSGITGENIEALRAYECTKVIVNLQSVEAFDEVTKKLNAAERFDADGVVVRM